MAKKKVNPKTKSRPAAKVTPKTIRGVMKNGRVELLDDISIANGSLLEITIVEPPSKKSTKTSTAKPTKKRVKAAKQKPQPATGPLSFSLFGKNQFTADPISFFKRLGNSTVSSVQFLGYKASCHIIPADPECALATYMLTFCPPPTKVAKAFRKVIKLRRNFEFNPGTRKATKHGDELKKLCESVPIGETESGISLWYSAIGLVIGFDSAVTNALTDLFEFGPLAEVEKAEAQKPLSTAAAKKILKEAEATIQSDIRDLVYDQLDRAAVRSRRKNSGTTASAKRDRKELSEISKRLVAGA